eukprot:5914895-Prymnesium_polylepis.1
MVFTTYSMVVPKGTSRGKGRGSSTCAAAVEPTAQPATGGLHDHRCAPILRTAAAKSSPGPTSASPRHR